MYYMWSRYSSIYVYICTPNIFLYTVYIIKLKGKHFFLKVVYSEFCFYKENDVLFNF